MVASDPLTEREAAEIIQLSCKYGLVKVFYDRGTDRRVVKIGAKQLRNFEVSRFDLLFTSDWSRILHDSGRFRPVDNHR